MTYTRQTWHNEPTRDTPITAERLGHIEDGIYDLHALIAGYAAPVVSTVKPANPANGAQWINQGFLWIHHNGWWYPNFSPAIVFEADLPEAITMFGGTYYRDINFTVPAGIPLSTVVFDAMITGIGSNVNPILGLYVAWHLAGQQIVPYVMAQHQDHLAGIHQWGGAINAKGFHAGLQAGGTYSGSINIWTSDANSVWDVKGGYMQVIVHPRPVAA